VNAGSYLDAGGSSCYGMRRFTTQHNSSMQCVGAKTATLAKMERGRIVCEREGLAVFLFKGFKDFILRGNLVDLAVGLVVGLAFSGLVQALVKDLITPLISIPGKFSFPDWSFSINHSVFQIGDFLNTLISFVIIAVVVFLFVVRPMAALLDEIKKREKQAAPETHECPFCLNQIPIKATRCGFCTSEVVAVAAATTVATEIKKK
jgi:large conductance mechanosensitive channel